MKLFQFYQNEVPSLGIRTEGGWIDVAAESARQGIAAPRTMLEAIRGGEAAREALWNRFDFEKYSDFVCERAVIELKKLLKRLPRSMDVRFVEDSAEIYSPPYYNYGGDELIFRIRARSHRSQKSMQRYLENFFREEWNKEFGSDYAIYEYIRENKGIEDFLLDEEAVS